ncbi:MAG TPA: hypothetical protein H9717_13905 [Candidatus Eisenbergiella merdipullorum]|uniref:Four-carbon acid sugar kinase family protein n=1 Tax=Candidatus Eisenbergiella merdipullorum TaxID=2838553 RepID=A0A9D2I7J4_9FIRM|nr:hypothetical protein [Candidatus Eisenbergiella merdipullorum]
MPGTIVIADDVTGANDIGIMYAKAGLDAYVYSYEEEGSTEYPPCDALIIDTDSRFDTHENAYHKVFHALERLPKENVTQYIDKQCSVFRGNIGAEFDAMLDALGEEFAVVVLGFPNNGRTTLHSLHYVNGTLLENSQFRNDPVHPMRKSDLVEILQEQTKRKVGAIHYEVYDRGEEAVRQALEDARGRYSYVIMDVRDNRDLELLARVLREEKVLCGSSALSEYLARLEAGRRQKQKPHAFRVVQDKVFCMAGSLTPQTIGQTAYMKEKGYPVITVDTTRVFDGQEKKAEEERVLTEIEKAYRTSDFVMIHSMNRPEEVEQTKRMAAKKGIDNTEVSSMVSGLLSVISQKAIMRLKIRRIIVCGGDTSASLCAHLGVRGMKVLEEIEAGLPTCESVEEPHYRMVLKSGSFGTPEFVYKAMEKLRLE